MAHSTEITSQSRLCPPPGWLPDPAAARVTNSGTRRDGGRALARKPAKDWLLLYFEATSLAKLNASSAMLERIDNKYVVPEATLRQAVSALAEHFDILEIDRKRAFTYETCYFDDARFTSYFHHHQGRRQRCKIRVRKYIDAQTCFVEVKLKDKRGATIKKRLDYPVDKYGSLDARAWAHIRAAYGDLYGRDFNLSLRPVLEIRYERVTLTAKDGGERMTIDCNLVFSGSGRSHSIGDSTYIIETKSGNGNGIADKILRGLHQHPTKHCSKYCVGAAMLQVINKRNNFLPALRKIGAFQNKTRNNVIDIGRNTGVNRRVTSSASIVALARE